MCRRGKWRRTLLWYCVDLLRVRETAMLSQPTHSWIDVHRSDMCLSVTCLHTTFSFTLVALDHVWRPSYVSAMVASLRQHLFHTPVDALCWRDPFSIDQALSLIHWIFWSGQHVLVLY